MLTDRSLLISFSIACGASVGTLMRWGLAHVVWLTPFPVSTLLVNVTGSLLLGYIRGWHSHKRLPNWLISGLAAGYCGSLTTMSTFTADTVGLLQNQPIHLAVLYLGITLAKGLLCAWAGLTIGHRVANRLRPA